MIKKNLLLIGGGGHCKACIDVIEMEGKNTIAGILDHQAHVGESILGYQIIGTDHSILSYIEQGYSFLITIGQINSAAARQRLFDYLTANNADVITVISPLAHVSAHAVIGRGAIVMHKATVSAEAKIGDNAILNTGCNVEHDTEIGSNCHVSTHAVINGGCRIGDGVFIGSNATVCHQISIGDQIIVGAGAVVNMNLDIQGKYAGVPAKRLLK